MIHGNVIKESCFVSSSDRNWSFAQHTTLGLSNSVNILGKWQKCGVRYEMLVFASFNLQKRVTRHCSFYFQVLSVYKNVLQHVLGSMRSVFMQWWTEQLHSILGFEGIIIPSTQCFFHYYPPPKMMILADPNFMRDVQPSHVGPDQPIERDAPGVGINCAPMVGWRRCLWDVCAGCLRTWWSLCPQLEVDI